MRAFRYAALAISVVICARPLSGQTPASPPAPSGVVSTDTPKATSAGATFTLPAGWAIDDEGPLVVARRRPRPTRTSRSSTSKDAKDADAAVAAAWAAYKPDSSGR